MPWPVKHRMSGTRLSQIYSTMCQRCSNPNHIGWSAYGGRGIQVCDDWRLDAATFYQWALANGYADDLCIDRINNNQGYSPENCRWVSYRDNSNNRNDNVLLLHDGRTQTIAQWARERGLAIDTLWRRLKRGWSVSDAITMPLHTRIKP